MSKSVCPHCKKNFEMGHNGTVDGCDSCNGCERDSEGRFWAQGENEMTLCDPATGKTRVITRSEAFKEARKC